MLETKTVNYLEERGRLVSRLYDDIINEQTEIIARAIEKLRDFDVEQIRNTYKGAGGDDYIKARKVICDAAREWNNLYMYSQSLFQITVFGSDEGFIETEIDHCKHGCYVRN